ncbi:MAG: transglutaminase-like domain-containing protein [Cyanobium sp.]
MQIRLGCTLTLHCPAPTPALALVHPHSSRRDDLSGPERLHLGPERTTEVLVDRDGNRWCRFLAAAGPTTLHYETTLRDHGLPDAVEPRARACGVEALPIESYRDLNPSRYCDSDALMDLAWREFGAIPPGWRQVQAICDWVHGQITYDASASSPDHSAADALRQGRGVCRDFAHAAVALCRAMNIPARYCSGYLAPGHGGVEEHPLDFSAWFEAWLEDRWYVFDARHNVPCVGRVLIGRGRDAADVPFLRTFGFHRLESLSVISERGTEPEAPATGAVLAGSLGGVSTPQPCAEPACAQPASPEALPRS